MQNSEESSTQLEAARLEKLRTQVQLEEIVDGIKQADGVIAELPAKLTAVRNAGYVYKNMLEQKIVSLGQRWQSIQPQIRAEHFRRRDEFNTEVSRLQGIINSGGSAGSVLDAFQSKVDLAKQNLDAMIKPVINDAQELQSLLHHLEWVLGQMAEASFKLLGAEALLEAVQANWKKPDDKDGVDGVLYLTDQRLVFEQKEEIVTKKVLFIATAKQKIQALMWGLPVQNITSATGSNRGFLNKDDFLTIACTGGAQFQSTDLHLKGQTGKSWRLQIDRIKNKDIALDRIGNEVEPEERLVNWGTIQPIMARDSFGRPSGITMAGNCSLVIHNPEAYQKSGGDSFVKNLLVQKLTEYVGEALASGRSLADINSSREAVGPALIVSTQPHLNEFNIDVKNIKIESVQISDMA